MAFDGSEWKPNKVNKAILFDFNNKVLGESTDIAENSVWIDICNHGVSAIVRLIFYNGLFEDQRISHPRRVRRGDCVNVAF